MSNEIIQAINDVTTEEKKSRKAVYEELLARGVVDPGSEQLVNEVIDYGLDKGSIPSGRIRIYKKMRGKLPTIFTTEQLIHIFEQCRRPKLAVVMWLGFFCGLRIKEACSLRVQDVNLERRRINVKDSKNPLRGKHGYGKDRNVTIPQVAIGPLQRWIKLLNGGEWLIPGMQSLDEHIRTKSIHEQFRQLLKECNLSEREYEKEYTQRNRGKRVRMRKSVYKYRFHTLRHTYATYLLEKGVPLENIQRSLGHRDIETTLIYARVTDRKTEEFVDDAFSRPLKLVNKESVLNPKTPHTTYNTVNALAIKENESAVDILQKRFASGEIDIVTYENMLRRLRS